MYLGTLHYLIDVPYGNSIPPTYTTRSPVYKQHFLSNKKSTSHIFEIFNNRLVTILTFWNNRLVIFDDPSNAPKKHDYPKYTLNATMYYIFITYFGNI